MYELNKFLSKKHIKLSNADLTTLISLSKNILNSELQRYITDRRNGMIRMAHLEMAKKFMDKDVVEDLAKLYFLGTDSIQKIIYTREK